MGIRITDLPTTLQKRVQEQIAKQGLLPPMSPPVVKAARRTGEPSGKLSELEMLFDAHLRMHGKDIPVPVPEHPFAKEAGRAFRFDRAWLTQRVAVELDGGVMSQGRHVQPAGFTEDCVKLNLAVVLGWRVLRFTSEMLLKDPVTCLNQVRELLRHKETHSWK